MRVYVTRRGSVGRVSSGNYLQKCIQELSQKITRHLCKGNALLKRRYTTRMWIHSVHQWSEETTKLQKKSNAYRRLRRELIL